MRNRLVATVLVLVFTVGGAGVASATMAMQKKAKELGFDATNCLYCHADKMPRKGAATYNDRGKWLQAEKDKRKAKEVDVAWLKDYKARLTEEILRYLRRLQGSFSPAAPGTVVPALT